MTPKRENRVKVSALLRAGHKVSEVANLVGVFRTIVYAIKKRMDDGKGVNRRAGSGHKTVTIHNKLSTTACTSVDTFTIVHALLDCVDGCARPTRFATSLTLYSARRSAETLNRFSLCGTSLKYTRMTDSFLWCRSDWTSCVLNKSRIITAKPPEL